mmetsp:Transcript_23428/g.34049  ORF Transcript_23428/g.34049 Transcript_23428/m.34049 type:complete len:88 (+) Transcript_23428:61-324(+)
MATKMCKRCKKQYCPSENNPRSCQFHPEWYGGETAQRWKAPGDVDNSSEIQYFWTCCGDHDSNSKGCMYTFHESYDDEEGDYVVHRK